MWLSTVRPNFCHYRISISVAKKWKKQTSFDWISFVLLSIDDDYDVSFIPLYINQLFLHKYSNCDTDHLGMTYVCKWQSLCFRNKAMRTWPKIGRKTIPPAWFQRFSTWRAPVLPFMITRTKIILTLIRLIIVGAINHRDQPNEKFQITPPI